MKEKSMIRDLTEGSLARLLITFSLPFMVANLLQSLYTLVDLAVVGLYVGNAALSAVSNSGQVTILLYAMGIGFSSGGQIYISQMIGGQDYKSLPATIGTLLSSQGLMAVIVALAGALLADPILSLLNTPAEAMEIAVEYLVICCVGVPFTYGMGAMCGVLRGMGDSKRPLYFIGISAVANVVLDLLFVAVFRWGAAGAAWATVIAQIVGFVFTFVFLYRRREEFFFDFRPASFAIDRKHFVVITRLSLPLVLMNASINISMLFVNSFINGYGVLASAVSGVGSKLYSIMSIVTSAIQTATASIVGQNLGAGRHDRMKKTVWIGWGFCLIFFVLVSGVALLFPQAVFSLFSHDPEVLAMAPDYLRISVFMYLAFALMSPPLGFINGVGATGLNFLIAILDGVAARIGLSILLGVQLGLGLYGFWIGSAMAGFVSVILGGAYFLSGVWKKRVRL